MGQIFGRAGGSLADSKTNSFAANAAVAAKGAAGERAVAKIINDYVRKTPNVHAFHDIDIPLMKAGKANIDHILVTGNKVIIIDAKQWTNGFYLRLGNFCFRSTHFKKFEIFEPGKKHTMDMALAKLGEYFAKYSVKAKVANSLLVVVPSDARYKQQMNLTFYKPFGAKAMTLDKFAEQIADIAPSSNWATSEDLLYRLKNLVN